MIQNSIRVSKRTGRSGQSMQRSEQGLFRSVGCVLESWWKHGLLQEKQKRGEGSQDFQLDQRWDQARHSALEVRIVNFPKKHILLKIYWEVLCCAQSFWQSCIKPWWRTEQWWCLHKNEALQVLEPVIRLSLSSSLCKRHLLGMSM